MLAAGQERVERRLLQRRPDGGPHLRPLLHDVVAGDPRRAARRRQERRQHQDRGGLAGAVRAEEAVDLARLDPQVYAVNGPRALLELPDEVLDLYPAVPPHYAVTFEAGELLARLPELCGGPPGRRAIFFGSIHLRSRVVLAAHPLDLRRGGQVDHGVGPLLRRPHERLEGPEQERHGPAVVRAEPGVDRARVHAGRRDTGSLQALRRARR